MIYIFVVLGYMMGFCSTVYFCYSTFSNWTWQVEDDIIMISVCVFTWPIVLPLLILYRIGRLIKMIIYEARNQVNK